MRGVFIMVVFGIVGGMFLICLEIMFKKHQRRMQKKDSMAKTAVRKWRGNVEVPTYRNFVKMSFSPLNALNLVSRNIFDYGKFWFFKLLQKRKTLRESNRRLKSNGYRGSMASGATLVHTPDSLTLSVGSLPQRPIYPSDSANPWQSPSCPPENMMTSERLPPPPVYREAIKVNLRNFILHSAEILREINFWNSDV